MAGFLIYWKALMVRKFVAVSTLLIILASTLVTVSSAAFAKESQPGPIIKPLPKSERKPLTIARSCDEKKGNCPKVNASENVQDIKNCEIADQTADWRVSSGFPRYPDAIVGEAKIDILVMPFEFADKKFSEKLYKNLQKEAKITEALYKRISNGVVELNMVFPKKADWVRFPKNNSDYLSMITSYETAINLVLNQGAYLKPADYDVIYLHSPWNFVANNLDQSDSRPFESQGNRVARARLNWGNIETYGHYAHEFGHDLFYLEDIYDRSKSGEAFQPSGTWDLMGAGGAFFGWFMYLNGWITGDQIDCLPPTFQSATHLLTPTSTRYGKKLIAITGEPGKLLMVEYRTGRVDEDLLSDGICNTGACAGDRNEGLVIYFLDTTINHLRGPISVPAKYYAKTMVTGERITYRGYKIEFLAKGRNGAYVRVGRA